MKKKDEGLKVYTSILSNYTLNPYILGRLRPSGSWGHGMHQ